MCGRQGAEGRATGYGVARRAAEEQGRTTVTPAGPTVTSAKIPDAGLGKTTTRTTAPDGTTTMVRTMRDPRFVSADALDTMEVETPFGLTSGVRAIRTVELADSSNPFSLVSQTGETGRLGLPRLLFGHPLRGGQSLVISAMLHNPTGVAYEGVTVRFVFEYVRTGRPWPLIPVYTFQMDVMFPAGDKDFDLPVGRTSRWWQGSPAVPGRILGVGGHLHPNAEALVLEDVTTGDTIWRGRPILNDSGQLAGVSIGRLYRKLGVEVFPDHVYRATVIYENKTGAPIPKGGMGLIAGVFMPSGPWPRPDVADPLYALDRAHYLREVRGSLAEITGAAPPPAPAAHDHGSHQH